MSAMKGGGRGKSQLRDDIGIAETLLGTEEAIAKALERLSDRDQISLFTDFEEEHVNNITISKVISNFLKKHYGFTLLEEAIDEFSTFRVSTQRKGRTEVVSMVTLQNLFDKGSSKRFSFSDLVSGGKR
jgi:hypothetical protein